MKKDYRNHPFMEGDTVYHFSHGKGVVTYTTEGYVHVMFDNGERALTQFAIELLSITPYEIPSNWERPHYEPKDGDIVFIPEHDSYASRVLIHKNSDRCYAGLNLSNRYAFKDGYVYGVDNLRPATPEEAQLLFDALEKEGWRWNAEKKELEKIPEPLKAGDLVIAWDDNKERAIIAKYYCPNGINPTYIHALSDGNGYKHAVKFESMDQYEKIRRGEI